MAITFVRTASAAGGSPQTATLAVAATAGNLLVGVASDAANSTHTWPTGWIAITGADRKPPFHTVEVRYKIAAGGETDLTISGGGTDMAAAISEFNPGGLNIGPVQGVNASDELGGTNEWPTLTLPTSGEVLQIAARVTQDFGSVVLPAAFTTRNDIGSLGRKHQFGDRIVAASAPPYAYTDSNPFDKQTTMVLVAFAALPDPGVWIDWNQNGFGDDSGAPDPDAPLARIMPEAAPASIGDNVTTRVIGELTWQRGGAYDHAGSAGPGGGSFFLRNDDGRFDPDNTASPVYGKMVPGLPVWGGAVRTTGALSGAGTVAGFMAGYVREFAPTVRDGQRLCEVVWEDALGRYDRTPVSVSPSLTRSHGALRAAVLAAAGESAARVEVEAEPGMLTFSSVDSASALTVLEELNKATASRHFIRPADSKEDWYRYVVVNKYHGLASAAAETISGANIDDISGWRVTNDNVIEVQRATVDPIGLTPNNATVWAYDDVPLTITNAAQRIIWAEFDDYVFTPSLDVNVSSGTVTSVLTNFGKTAKIELWATSTSAVIGKLRILGQQVVRGDTEQVVAGDQSAGKRAGSTISTDLIGSRAMAQGICDFTVWKFGSRLKRPAFAVTGKTSATFGTLFDRDCFDVVNLVVDKLSVTTRRVEIVGLAGSASPGRYWRVQYQAQETPNQAVLRYLVVGDTVGSAYPIAPF